MPRFSNSDTLIILKDHDSDAGNTPPNATFWTLKTTTLWILATAYSVNDIVEDSGKLYTCTVAHTSSYDNEPPNTTNWTLINIWSNGVTPTVGQLVEYSGKIYSSVGTTKAVFGPDGNGDVDISSYMVAGEYEDAVPQSLKLTLNSKNGRFETTGPIIQKFDRIYFQSIINGKTINEVFHVRTISRTRLEGFGMVLVLDCPHQSENKWKQTISFPGRKISGNTALSVIARQLNASKGSADPTVEIPSFDKDTKVGSRLARNTSNDYIFEAVKLEVALKYIKDIEQQPVTGGGSFEAMYIRFTSKYNHSTGSDLDTVQFQAFEQGYTNNDGTFNNTPKVTLKYETIESGDRPTVLNLETIEDPPQATNLILTGHKKSGSYPTEFQKFVGAKDVFNAAQLWDVGTSYLKGDLVTFEEKTYEAKIDNTGNQPDTSTTEWVERTFTKPNAWVTSTSYSLDDVIRNDNIAYKCIQANTSSTANQPPNDAFWIRVYYAPTVDYSPQTKDRAQDWINWMAGAKFASENNSKTSVVDHNCIIIDEKHPRNPVRVVIDDPSDIPVQHLINGTQIPNAYKVLVATTNFTVSPATATDAGTGTPFDGNDPNGVTFAGNIAEYRDPDEDGTGTWYVFKETSDDEEILDWDENNSWTKNPCSGSALTYIDENSVCQLGSRKTTWILGSYRLLNILGFDRVQFINTRKFDCVHELAYDTTNKRVKVENTKLLEDDEFGTSAVSFQFEPPANASLEDRRYFAGANYWSLSPLTTFGSPYSAIVTISGGGGTGASAIATVSTTGTVLSIEVTNGGSGYTSSPTVTIAGGTTLATAGTVTIVSTVITAIAVSTAGSGYTPPPVIGNKILLSVFDFFNMFKTHQLKEEWFGSQVEDYLPIQGFNYSENLKITIDAIFGTFDLTGDYTMEMWFSDARHNIVTVEYNHSRNNVTLNQDNSLSKMEAYAAVPGISVLFASPEPEFFDVFQEREWQFGGILTKDSYDDQGRYKAKNSRFNGKSSIQLILDAWRMIKPLVSTNVDESSNKPTRNIETIRQKYDGIISYAQLKTLTFGLEKLFNFERKEVMHDTPALYDIQFGDPVYSEDSLSFSESDDSKDNTILAVADKIVYTFSKPVKGPGGIKRKVYLVTRLFP